MLLSSPLRLSFYSTMYWHLYPPHTAWATVPSVRGTISLVLATMSGISWTKSKPKWRRFGFWSPSWSFICPGVNSQLFSTFLTPKKQSLSCSVLLSESLHAFLISCSCWHRLVFVTQIKKAKQNQEAHKSNSSWTESLLNTCDRVTRCGYTHSSVDPAPVL